MEDGETAVACALDGEGMKTRVEHWNELLANNLIESKLIPGGVRLVLRPTHTASAKVRRLVALENSCCTWIDWSIDEGSTLDVDATADHEYGVALLREWFGPRVEMGTAPRG